MFQFYTYLIMLILVIINGLNSGGYAFFNISYLNRILGRDYAKYFFMAVGISAIVLAYRIIVTFPMPKKEDPVLV